MGKHLWMKHVSEDKSHDKQPGCIWGLVHALGYNIWQFNVRKMIPHRRYEGQTHIKCEWSPNTKVHNQEAYEKEKLLDDNETTPYFSTKRSRKKRSLRARIKTLIADDISKESENTRAKRGRSLQRTYSIHHLESLNDDKIYPNWKHPIIFLPRKMDNSSNEEAAKQETDVLDIFKVDKNFLINHLQNADEGVVNFTRSALGLNKKEKFTKSRSFPMAELSQGKKLKPMKLENKQKEDVWSFPREEKEIQIVDKKAEKNDIRKLTHNRSSSLNESLGKYARLFENSFGTDAKLNSSKSLKLANEYGSVHFRRISSLSNVDSYCFNSNFEVLEDDGEEEKIVSNKEALDGCNIMEIKDNDSNLMIDDDCEETDGLKQEDNKLMKSDFANEELQEKGFILDSKFLSEEIELQISQGLEHESRIADEISDKNIKSSAHDIRCPKENNSDMNYVRHLLDQSGITKDASEMTLGPQLFEEAEASWPHNQDQLTGYHPNFSGCWHHQMLFDLVNEVLLDVYDVSIPYYPKSLSSNCHIPPFPSGNHLCDVVTTSIGTLMNLKSEEKQSLESIVANDLAHEGRWMNLQFDTECLALDLEDVIFEEILEEIIFS